MAKATMRPDQTGADPLCFEHINGLLSYRVDAPLCDGIRFFFQQSPLAQWSKGLHCTLAVLAA